MYQMNGRPASPIINDNKPSEPSRFSLKKLLIFLAIFSCVGLLMMATLYTIPSPSHYIPNPKMLTFSSSSTVLLTSKSKSYVAGRKRILIYTRLFGRPWYNVPDPVPPNYILKLHCNVSDCDVTYDHNLLSSSDAVLFHARDMPDVNHLRTVRRSKCPRHQRWTYFISESPLNTPSPQALNGLFNLTATFKKDSDIWVPYGKYLPLSPKDKRPDVNKNYAAGKENGISWVVSHCGLLRQEYVKKLQDLYPVFVGGNCRGFYSKQMNCPKDCGSEIGKYKFYLAFENTFCQEYTTEKYWYHPLMAESLPIVMGGGPYNNGLHGAIPGSFINVEDFSTIKDLADYLRYLEKNDTAYNEYFKWKQTYKLWAPEYGWPYPSVILCELCDIVHQENYPENVVDLGTFWGPQFTCDGRDKKVKEILSRS